MNAPPAGASAPRSDADLFAEAARRSAAREAFALCTVAATERSAPRDAGSKMLVSPEGAIYGTVGGGPLEAVVIAEAVQLLRTGGTSGLRKFSLDAGGQSAAAHLPAQPLSGAPDDDFLGMKCGGEVEVLIDLVRPAARLLLYGAGHVGERVAALAGEVGFPTVVIDDRKDFVVPERFPRAQAVLADLDAQPLGGLTPDPSEFIVIVTRCHALDEKVLEAALASKARYIGLIGSRRKIGVVLKSIAQRTGKDPRADLRLHAPIGLKLGDKTPGEIALSILAELVLIKSEGELAHSRLAPKIEEAMPSLQLAPKRLDS
ncbi:MAG: XdhC family protein [Deltaproteobacteria bacterium]|nr:XdhC family protein [Deltaproteobacteria bacterium]